MAHPLTTVDSLPWAWLRAGEAIFRDYEQSTKEGTTILGGTECFNKPI
jgi:hypothetical protein